MNSLDHGVPQNRQRLYIIGLRAASTVKPFCWPQSSPRVLLEDILAPVGDPHARVEMMSGANNRNLQAALQDLHRRGLDPQSKTYAIDVDTGRWTSKLWSCEHARCLTKARGSQGGPYLTTHGRRTSLIELGRLQGVDVNAYNVAGLTKSQMGGMLGNAMTKPVVMALVKEMWVSLGIMGE